MAQLGALTKSYWHEPRVSRPLKWLTLPQIIDENAKKYGDKEAYVVRMNGRPRESVSYNGLREKTECLAAGLFDMGLKRGDFVLISGITCVDWIICDFACASVGIIPIRSRMSVLTKDGLVKIMNTNHVRALFFHPGETGEFEKHLKKCLPDAFIPSEEGIACADIPCLQHLIRMGVDKSEGSVCIKSLMDGKDVNQQVIEAKQKVDTDDLIAVFMTSGSTGFPKAVPYTHFHLLNGWLCRGLMGVCTEKGRTFNDRSLAWMGSTLHNSMVFGYTTVYLHPLTNATNNDIDFCLKVMAEEKINSGVLLQYLALDILERFESGTADPIYFDWVMTGGEVVQKNICERLSKYVSAFMLGYGATECLCIASSLKDDPFDKICQYAGFVEEGIEVKIVNGDGETVPFGETGEIVIRSSVAFTGYLQEESKGMPINKDGWIRTDDAGFLTKDGYIKVHGRISQVISRGITLTYPAVVEQVMQKFSGVAKVAVFGVPDKRLGENICAAVIPAKGAAVTSESLRKCFDDLYQTDEGLGMTPAFFMIVDELPTVNAKIDRKTLRELAIKQFKISV